jgi:putative peptidoglycan lipid II flippase
MREMERGLSFALFWTFLAMTMLIALDKQSVSVAFQRGMFDFSHVRVTADAVVGFSLGLPAYILMKVFSSLYFAAGDTKTPVIFGIISVILNVIFLLLLVPFFKYFGLALCTSLSAISNAIMLICFSSRKMPIRFSRAFWMKILSQLLAAAATYFALSFLVVCWDQDPEIDTVGWFVYFALLLCGVAVFFVTTIICMYATKQKQWKLWKRSAW